MIKVSDVCTYRLDSVVWALKGSDIFGYKAFEIWRCIREMCEGTYIGRLSVKRATSTKL